MLHLVSDHPSSTEDRQLYIFPDGCVVFWNCEGSERWKVLNLADKFRIGSKVKASIVEEESEDLAYSYQP